MLPVDHLELYPAESSVVAVEPLDELANRLPLLLNVAR
jgi:hypothetical protein